MNCSAGVRRNRSKGRGVQPRMRADGARGDRRLSRVSGSKPPVRADRTNMLVPCAVVLLAMVEPTIRGLPQGQGGGAEGGAARALQLSGVLTLHRCVRIKSAMRA